ncbi:Redoxin, partial [Phlebopus sp. FC_14]
DGLADHLPSHELPLSILLSATSGPPVDLRELSLQQPVLVFVYPRTGEPGVSNPPGWDDIPGARGCTPELCTISDSIDTLQASTTHPRLSIFGLSTQSTTYQTEAANRLHLPYPILSDASFQLTDALKLPTFEVEGMVLLKRITLLVYEGKVVGKDYPVFPSNEAAKRAVGLLKLLDGSS